MNENDEYSHVQRRLCAVIAKSEWTSSRMRMQKSGEELRERRAKSHRTANQFLQELLDKRTDSDLIDDNGAVDRYHKFVKYKSAFNDDTNSTLDEFHRRLRDLNNNQRNQPTKFNTILHQQFSKDLQPTIELRNDQKDNVQQQVQHDERAKPSRTLPSVSNIPTTSTPNDTTNELSTSTFHVDEIQELSDVQSPNVSFIDSETNPIESPNHHHHSSLFEKLETLNSSTSSSNPPLTQTLYAPKARRPDGSEIVLSTSSSSSSSSSSLSKSSLPGVSSNISLFNHSYLPRSLTSRGKLNTSSTLKRRLPLLPTTQSSEQNSVPHEQFNTDQLYDLLDNLDNQANQFSHSDFTNKLDQLTLSTVTDPSENQIHNNLWIENTSIINDQEENSLPNFFNPSLLSSQEKQFYTTLQIDLNDIKSISLYTMTLSTVQFSASILLPYSILTGRRPSLKCSNQTCFKQVHSKQQKNRCQVTAIESSLNIQQLQQNDIILKINDQSVWGFTTDEINDILEQYNQRSESCSLTLARLCQPFIKI